MNKIAIFASGSGTNAINIINFFANNEKIQVKAILCNKQNAPIVDKAKIMGVDVLVFTKAELNENQFVFNYLKNAQIDIIILAGFLWLIPEEIINAYSNRILNIHPALLPKYGGKGMYGMNVHNAVIANKEKFTGITIHYVNKEYDDGDILFQAQCEVLPTDTPEILAQKIHELEYKHYPEIIKNVIESLNN